MWPRDLSASVNLITYRSRVNAFILFVTHEDEYILIIQLPFHAAVVILNGILMH